MPRKKEISIQELLRASKMNLKDGKTIEEISRELNIGSRVLRSRMDEHNIKYVLCSTKKKRNKISSKTLYISQIQAKRNQYKKGQEVYIENLKNPVHNNGSYYLNGLAIIKEIHKDFIVVETKKELRECIGFIAIIKNEIKVC